jgi:hypothetical protein
VQVLLHFRQQRLDLRSNILGLIDVYGLSSQSVESALKNLKKKKRKKEKNKQSSPSKLLPLTSSQRPYRHVIHHVKIRPQKDERKGAKDKKKEKGKKEKKKGKKRETYIGSIRSSQKGHKE